MNKLKVYTNILLTLLPGCIQDISSSHNFASGTTIENTKTILFRALILLLHTLISLLASHKMYFSRTLIYIIQYKSLCIKLINENCYISAYEYVPSVSEEDILSDEVI